MGTFNNEIDLKYLASTFPSGKRGKHVRLSRNSTSPFFDLSTVKLVIHRAALDRKLKMKKGST